MVFHFASTHDINDWMKLLELVEDSFPGLDKEAYKIGLHESILKKEALIAKKDGLAVGLLAFSYKEKELTFLAVHPKYRNLGIAQNLLKKMISLFSKGTQLSVITYRERDPQGVAARNLYLNFGFRSGELIMMFDYPCQKMIYIV